MGKLKAAPADRGLGWYQSTLTLSPPVVPSEPGPDWWNKEVVAQVRQSMANPDSVTVLLTGRSVEYADVLATIASSCSLQFDAVGLKPSPDQKTFKFKTEFITALISKYNPEQVNVWEDRAPHVEQFTVFFLSKGIEAFTIHEVADDPYPISEDVEMEVIRKLMEKAGGDQLEIRPCVEYTGVFLDQQSHRALLRAFPPQAGWSVKAHHMTMTLGEIKEKTFPPEIPPEKYQLGRKVEMVVVGYGQSDKAAAVRVLTDAPTVNAIPHVTVAISSTGRAKDRNDIRVWDIVRVVGDHQIPEEAGGHSFKTNEEEKQQQQEKTSEGSSTTVDLEEEKPKVTETVVKEKGSDVVTDTLVVTEREEVLVVKENKTDIEGAAPSPSTVLQPKVIEFPEPIILTGEIKVQSRLTIAHKPRPVQPKLGPQVNFGKLLVKHHPGITGPQIGKAVPKIKKWLLETQTDDETAIEEYIKNLSIDE